MPPFSQFWEKAYSCDSLLAVIFHLSGHISQGQALWGSMTEHSHTGFPYLAQCVELWGGAR